MPTPVTEDELVKVIRWQLGLSVDGSDSTYKGVWNQLLTSRDRDVEERLNRVSGFLSELTKRMVRHQLGLTVPGLTVDERAILESLWSAFENWMNEDPVKRSPKVSGLIRDAVTTNNTVIAVPPIPANAVAAPPRRSQPPAVVPPTRPAVRPPPLPPPLPVPQPPAPASTMPPPPNPPRVRPPASPWQYRPVPAHEPEPHPEFAQLAVRSAEGNLLLGARVRGKKHKHEGTNCDDWFEAQLSGAWTVIAVSDGAGSRRLSRIGARFSCTRAIATLSNELAAVRLSDRPTADGFQNRDEHGKYLDAELVVVQSALHRAMQAASESVAQEAAFRQCDPAYTKLLGRPVALEDLSATLLLAAHTTLSIEGVRQQLVVACQVGDGMTAAVDPQGKVTILGIPDSGDYSGETDFLTSRRQLDPANLQRKTFIEFGPFHTVLVMTDGVADDYFPADPGMARLYTDLVLNGVLSPAASESNAEANGLGFDPSDGRLDGDAETVAAEPTTTYRLRSAAQLASELGVKPEELAAHANWLRAGAQGSPLAVSSLELQERLRTWLDTYHVRGSFDDRTLVVLACGGGR